MLGHDPVTVGRRLEEFRKNLLDISLRNRLVNFRTRTKAGKDIQKVVEAHGESSVELYRILVTEKKAMRFIGKPDPRPSKKTSQSGDEDSNDNEDLQPVAGQDTEIAATDEASEDAVDQTDLKVSTNYTVSNLQRKLLKIQRDAKVAIEEQGVNVLFLALGTLHWYEAETSEEERNHRCFLSQFVSIPQKLATTSWLGMRVILAETSP